MKKIAALLISLVLIFFGTIGKVSAADWYKVSLVREVYLDNTTQYNVINTFTLNNTSSNYIIKSFDYFSPLPFTDAKASINGKNMKLSITGSHIIIDLGDQVLKPLKQEVLKIQLKVPDLFQPVRNISGNIIGAQLFLPKDTTKALDIYCQTTINFNDSEFKPTYLSTNMVIDGNKIQATKNIDMYIDFTKVSGFNMKFSGETNSIILPSSIFNKVLFENIPADGILSSDTVGNSYLSKQGLIEYGLKVYKKVITDNEFMSKISYFPKSDLEKFKLEDSIRGFYDQVLKKYDPETQTLNTQYLTLEKYETNVLNDSLGYSLTFASLLQQKNIPAEVIFGKVKFPLSQGQNWHFWVVYSDEGVMKQADPYFEDLLTFDGFNNLSPQRAIVAGYFNDSNLINAIDNLIKDKVEIEFITEEDSDSQQSAKLEVIKMADTFYPKLKISYKNLSSSTIQLKWLEVNGVYSPFAGLEINPGSQKDFEVYLAMNIVDIVARKGEVEIKATVNEDGVEKVYETTTKIPQEILLTIVMVNFVAVAAGLAIVVIIFLNKRPKIH